MCVWTINPVRVWVSVSAHKMASSLSSCRPVVEQIIGSGTSRVPRGPEPGVDRCGLMWSTLYCLHFSSLSASELRSLQQTSDQIMRIMCDFLFLSSPSESSQSLQPPEGQRGNWRYNVSSTYRCVYMFMYVYMYMYICSIRQPQLWSLMWNQITRRGKKYYPAKSMWTLRVAVTWDWRASSCLSLNDHLKCD